MPFLGWSNRGWIYPPMWNNNKLVIKYKKYGFQDIGHQKMDSDSWDMGNKGGIANDFPAYWAEKVSRIPCEEEGFR